MKNLTKKFSAFITIVVATFTITGITASSAFAAGGHGAAVDTVHMNLRDKASLQNGAKIFVNYCLSCHSAGYARYNLVAEDLDIPLSLLSENMMFTTEKTGDLMKTTMPAEDSKIWWGVTPPDLTLVSRVRKPNWLYTYFRAFYQDENSPSGWNNSLFENVSMPHALYELQGVQRYVGKVETGGHGGDAHAAEGAAASDGTFNIVGDSMFELVHPGKLSPAEFDVAMTDLTAFLTYLAEPAVLKRKTIGVYTLGFLILLMGLCYLLKKEFWRDVH